jgi:phospholipid-binding lipoprotein MlaA
MGDPARDRCRSRCSQAWHGSCFIPGAADATAEDRTLRAASKRDSDRWWVTKAIELAAAAAAILVVGGCATQVADPVSEQTVEVPDSDDSGSDPGDDASDIDPNVISVDPNVVSYDDYNDPLMPMNRFIFGFNDIVGRYALIPLGKGYARIVPDPVDERIDNFFYNAASPIYAVNNLLQAEPRKSGRNLARFGINTTIGLLGLFDPAEAWFGLERAESDFAETLAHHGAGYGTYLVLPFFGPSDTRNATARVVDYFLHPIPWVLDNPESFFVMSYGYFHDFAQGAEDYEKLFEESEDPYIFLRNLHLQSIQRDAAYRK